MKRSAPYIPLAGMILFILLYGATLWAGPLTKSQEKGQGPMVIKSKTLEADDKKKQIVFSGDVEAKRDDFTVLCRKLVVFYENKADKKKSGEVSSQIDRIVATGAVKIVRAEGGTATGEKAVFYQKDEKLVLTGKPVVKQGEDFVEGDVITLFLREDRSVVESEGSKKVKAVIFPKKEKGKEP